MAQRVAAYMSDELKAEVKIGKLDFDLFNYATIEEFYVTDLHSDTLLYVPELFCYIDDFSFKEERLILSKTILRSPRINLKKYKGEKDMNYGFIEDYFSSDKPKTKESKPWNVQAAHILIDNADFTYDDENKAFSEFGVDFDHLHLQKLVADLSDFHQEADTIFFDINRIALRDQSGFVVDTLQAEMRIAPDKMSFSNLVIKTPGSRILTDNLSFLYSSFDDFDDFIEKVTIKTKFDHSILDLNDISYFASELKSIDRTILLKGAVRGTVANLRMRKMEIYLTKDTYVKGNFDILGLPDAENAVFTMNVNELKTNTWDIVSIELPPFDSTQYVGLPGRYGMLGDISVKGNFIGSSKDFVAYGEAKTNVGLIKTDLHFYIDTTDNYFHYNGDLKAIDFRAGEFYDIAEMGNVTLDLKVNATGLTVDNLNAKIKGSVPSLTYLGYNYSGITIDGDLLHTEKFDGTLNVNDENLKLSFNGNVDFSQQIPRYEITNLDVFGANLRVLNLISDRDSSSSLCMRISANAQGDDIDNFSGSFYMRNIIYYENGKEYFLKKMNLMAFDEYKTDSLTLVKNKRGKMVPKTDTAKILEIDSDILYAKFDGRFKFYQIQDGFLYIVSKTLPALFDNQVAKIPENQDFKFEVNIRDFTPVTELFLPDIELSKNTEFSGKFNSKTNVFRLKSEPIKKLTISAIEMNDLVLNAKNNGDYLSVNANSSGIYFGDSVGMENFRMTTEMLQNRIATDISWSAPDSSAYGKIIGEGILHSASALGFNIKPSEVKLNNKIWYLRDNSQLAIEGSKITIRNFDIYSGKETITLAGIISEDRNDKLDISFSNFNIENLNPLINDSLLVIHGTLNGYGFVADLYQDVFFATDVKLDSFRLNDDYLGDFKLVNLWDNEEKRVHTTGELKRKELRSVEFSGDYYTKSEENNIDYIIELKETNLQFLNTFLPPDVSNLRGLASGKLTLKGSAKDPLLKGKLNFEHGAIKVNMLNTEYFFGGKVTIAEDMIAFDSIPLSDLKGNLGWAQGTFFHNNYESWNFDCVLQFRKLLCMNTTEEMNPLYYGRAYASGTVNVFAYGGNVDIEVDVKTEKGTRIVLPLYGSSDETLQEFVHFVDHDTTKKTENKKVDLSGITMKFDFDITPEAEVMIVFDKLAGDMMRGRGNGKLTMEIDQLGEFYMYGQYLITQGNYLFTLMNVINKPFVVKPGSSLSWYGDPMEADINLTAVYTAQTSPFEIMPADIAPKYKNNIDVECQMNLKNNLFKPDVTFDIAVPRADENVKSALTVIRGSDQELTRQFFALLAINKFLPLTNSISTAADQAYSGVKATTSDLLSSQLSNWLSQLSDEFDIGFNYKPGDEISNQEIALAMSTQLLNDRLTISTNLGVSQGNSANQNPNNIIGDFNVEYKVNEDGTFRLRGFNESNTFDVTNTTQAPFTQGVGVYYTEEFDSLGDLKFFRKMKKIFSKKDKTAVLTDETDTIENDSL